jgi:hypothetical protein
MKVFLDVKNMSKVIKPSTENVMLFDGKQWYVTTKQELFKEYDEKLVEFDQMIQENKEFKKSVASQLLEMSELIKTLYKK